MCAVSQDRLGPVWTAREVLPPGVRTHAMALSGFAVWTDGLAHDGEQADRQQVLARWCAATLTEVRAGRSDHPLRRAFVHTMCHYELDIRVLEEFLDATMADSLQVRRPSGNVSMLIEWYRVHGQRWSAERVALWAGRIGVIPRDVVVRALGTTWGQREKDSSLVFHWAAVQLSPRLLDLIVVHELVHLDVPRHDAEFKRRVLLALPDAPLREAELAHAGRRVWIGALRVT